MYRIDLHLISMVFVSCSTCATIGSLHMSMKLGLLAWFHCCGHDDLSEKHDGTHVREPSASAWLCWPRSFLGSSNKAVLRILDQCEWKECPMLSQSRFLQLGYVSSVSIRVSHPITSTSFRTIPSWRTSWSISSMDRQRRLPLLGSWSTGSSRG